LQNANGCKCDVFIFPFQKTAPAWDPENQSSRMNGFHTQRYNTYASVSVSVTESENDDQHQRVKSHHNSQHWIPHRKPNIYIII